MQEISTRATAAHHTVLSLFLIIGKIDRGGAAVFDEELEDEYVWEARAEYEDGMEVCKYFPYNEDGDNDKEQFLIEEWLVSHHGGCTWYSVAVIPISLMEY